MLGARIALALAALLAACVVDVDEPSNPGYEPNAQAPACIPQHTCDCMSLGDVCYIEWPPTGYPWYCCPVRGDGALSCITSEGMTATCQW